MTGERRALLVAADAYNDPDLTRLRVPKGDVRALAEVLADPTIGGFDVRALVNRATDEGKKEIEGFFDEARPQDLMLFYVSGHSALLQTRRLYFATATARLKRLRDTAIEDRFVSDVMQHSRARSIVLVLDCCYSGVFAARLAPKGALGVDMEQSFDDHAQVVVVAASTSLQYAFEATDVEMTLSDFGAGVPGSLFSRSLLEGLKAGAADVDQDGRITVGELYDYVYARMSERSPNQTPSKTGGDGDIVIARPSGGSTLPAAVRADVVTDVGEAPRSRGTR